MRVEDLSMMQRVDYKSTEKQVAKFRKAKDEMTYASMHEFNYLKEKENIVGKDDLDYEFVFSFKDFMKAVAIVGFMMALTILPEILMPGI